MRCIGHLGRHGRPDTSRWRKRLNRCKQRPDGMSEEIDWEHHTNGCRDRTFDTRLGALSPRLPKLRQGSYFPPFVEPRKTAGRALAAVIQEAWIGGVSIRRVDDLVQAMGLTGISKSQRPPRRRKGLASARACPGHDPGTSTSG